MTAFFYDFLDAPEASMRAAYYGFERHGENVHVQTHACAQQVRTSAHILPTRCFRFSCTLH